MIELVSILSSDDRTVLRNLFELYLYDLSTVEEMPLGARQ